MIRRGSAIGRVEGAVLEPVDALPQLPSHHEHEHAHARTHTNTHTRKQTHAHAHTRTRTLTHSHTHTRHAGAGNFDRRGRAIGRVEGAVLEPVDALPQLPPHHPHPQVPRRAGARTVPSAQTLILQEKSFNLKLSGNEVYCTIALL